LEAAVGFVGDGVFDEVSVDQFIDRSFEGTCFRFEAQKTDEVVCGERLIREGVQYRVRLGLDFGGGFFRSDWFDGGGMEGECGEDASGIGFEGVRGQSGGFAGAGHFFNAAAPGVDVAGFEIGGGKEGIPWFGGMRAEEGFSGEVVGELAFVPQGEAGVLNAALDVDAAAVGFVDEGVQKGFAEGLTGVRRSLVTVKAFETDSFDEELAGVGEEALDRSGVDIIDRGAVFDDGVPGEAGLVEKEFVEQGALAFLGDAAISLVVAASKGNRNSGGGDSDF
jgi:hypothetical protein